MLAVSAHLPFSEVCSTVSCWALIFSVVFPPAHVLGFELTSSSTSAPVVPVPNIHGSLPGNPSSPSTDRGGDHPRAAGHHHRHQHHHSNNHRTSAAATYSFTVYLDSTLHQRLSFPASSLSLSAPCSFPCLPDLFFEDGREECALSPLRSVSNSRTHNHNHSGSRAKGMRLQKRRACQQPQPQQQERDLNQKYNHHHRHRPAPTSTQQGQAVAVNSPSSGRLVMNSAQNEGNTPRVNTRGQKDRELRKISEKDIKRVCAGSQETPGSSKLGKLTRSTLRRLTSSGGDHGSPQHEEHQPSFLEAFLGKKAYWPCPICQQCQHEEKEALSAAQEQEEQDALRLHSEGNIDYNYDRNSDDDIVWRGRVYATSTPKDEAPLSFAGPLWNFPRSWPQQQQPSSVHFPWLALVPCTVQSIDHFVAATRLGASAVIFYAPHQTQNQDQDQDKDQIDCGTILTDERAYLSANTTMPAEPALILEDYITDTLLALILDGLEGGFVASAEIMALDSLSSHLPSDKASEPNAVVAAIEKKLQENVLEQDSPHPNSMDTLFKSGTGMVKQMLLKLGLHGSAQTSRGSRAVILRHDRTAELKEAEEDIKVTEEKGMISTPFLPLYTAALTQKQRRAVVTTEPQQDQQSASGAGSAGDGDHSIAPATATLPQPHPEQLLRKQVVAERISVSGSGSSLIYRRSSSAQSSSVTHRLVQRIYSFSPSKFAQDATVLARDDSMTGKLAMVLMSVVCGVGVGMFGALLFVVALKVRLFQTRRRGYQNVQGHGGFHAHLTATQQQQAHQQMREAGCKRVIPKGVLDSFGVQTVLHTSTTTMTTTPVEVTKKDLGLAVGAGSFKAKLGYAEDVIEMEEGFEGTEERENARRQRLRTRTSHLFPHAAQDDSEEGEQEAENAVVPDRSHNNNAEETLWDALFEGEDMEELLSASRGERVVPESVAGAMDMEGITAAIMHATRQGSYRRISLSRGGQSELETLSSTSGVSSSSVSTAVSLSISSESHPHSHPHLHPHFHPHLHLDRGNSNGNSSEKHRNGVVDHHHAGEDEDEADKEKKLPFANANAQTMCSICLGEYEVGDQVRTLPCYHQYHMSCIDPWLLNVASLCPICKRDLLPGGSP